MVTTVAGIREAFGGRSLVKISDGYEVEADAVVVAIGIVPNVERAEKVGAAVETPQSCGGYLKSDQF